MAKMKLKTNRSAAKRVKTTGTGKLKRNQAGRRHLLTGKDASRKRNLRGSVLVDKDNVEVIRRLLPYGSK